MGILSRFWSGEDKDQDSRAPAADPSTQSERAPASDVPGNWDFGALSSPPAPPPTVDTNFVPDAAVTRELEPRIVEAIKTVFDPEIPVDIYELGLIYDIQANADRHVHIRMTLTSPACPSAQQLPSEVRYKVKGILGVTDATVDVVWDPPWDKDRMSDVAKLSLGMF